MNSHLQYIIEKCHLANPKLLDISEGCRVNTKNGIRIVNYIIQKDKRGDEMVVYCPFRGGVAESDYTSSIKNKVIGHPITLQDILLAMGKKWGIAGDGQFVYRLDKEGFVGEKHCAIQSYIYKVSFCKYDMSKSPYDQEESVLEFISKNI